MIRNLRLIHRISRRRKVTSDMYSRGKWDRSRKREERNGE